MRTHRERQLRHVTVGATLLCVVAIAACGGAQVPAGPAQTTRPAAVATYDDSEVTEPPSVAGGSWTGTITLHAVINKDESKDVTSGDVGSTYYETGTTHDTTQTDVTDTFSVTGQDPDDVSYGMDGFDFGGAATNAGTTLERYIQNWNKQNSGCTWKEELGDQTSGSWSGTGKTAGSLRLSEDGSYHMELSASVGDANGEYQTPQLPHRLWLKNSDISAGCTGDTDYDTTDTQGPVIWWASSLLGETDVNNKYAMIDGQISGTPGNTIDGSSTWNLVLPAAKLDITWHLVHSGPIVLPHS